MRRKYATQVCDAREGFEKRCNYTEILGYKRKSFVKSVWQKSPQFEDYSFSKVFLFVGSLLANNSPKTVISSVECPSELKCFDTLAKFAKFAKLSLLSLLLTPLIYF